MRCDIWRYYWLIACMWLGWDSSLSRLRVCGWVFLAIFQCCQKIIDMFHPIQRMFNCFKGFDGKASHVWIVITPCLKFILVLKENIVVNISPLNEQPVRSAFSSNYGLVFWRGLQCSLDFLHPRFFFVWRTVWYDNIYSETI